jgi:hypothetical protein
VRDRASSEPLGRSVSVEDARLESDRDIISSIVGATNGSGVGSLGWTGFD